MKNNFAVIMAGGVGSRFWPMSQETKPKQFLDVLGIGKTLIQMTHERLLKLVPADQIYVVTNTSYADLVEEQLGLPRYQILTEPMRKNTAPCIAYAAHKNLYPRSKCEFNRCAFRSFNFNGRSFCRDR
jgi:mannose-1-phosphate guanylyltransferase